MKNKFSSMFGTTADGQKTHTFTIRNEGIQAVLTDYGATVLSLEVLDREKKPRDVVLGYDTLGEYEKGSALYGATVGRVANRIENARFHLNGKEYCLDKNEGENCNHSGGRGFHKRVWTVGEGNESAQEFMLFSPDRDQGFPGNLKLGITFSVRDDAALMICYRAEADQDTLLNVTNHCYFNLNGQGNGDILDHRMQIFAFGYMPLRGSDSIPDGTVRNVISSPFDFTCPKCIGKDINYEDIQLKFGQGYNHNYMISESKGAVKTAAKVVSMESGIGMEVRTDMPGLQFYTGNELVPELGKKGAEYYPRSGFALETQYAPNSINSPGFAPCILRKGIVWESKTVYRFYRI